MKKNIRDLFRWCRLNLLKKLNHLPLRKQAYILILVMWGVAMYSGALVHKVFYCPKAVAEQPNQMQELREQLRQELLRGYQMGRTAGSDSTQSLDDIFNREIELPEHMSETEADSLVMDEYFNNL